MNIYMYGIINIYTYVYILLIIFQIARFEGDFLDWFKLEIENFESRGDDG